jgi:hypothetical protein
MCELSTAFKVPASSRWECTGNMPNSNPCTWDGVVCEREKEDLISIELTDKGLSGTLPPSIGMLTGLILLSLSLNNMKGTIPSAEDFFQNYKKKSLGLGGNNVTGTIPPSIAQLTSLTLLSLNFNNLNGPIPPNIGELIEMVALGLGDNKLTGSIPSSIFKMSKLVGFDLTNNMIIGSIQSNIVELKNLKI